MTNEEAIKIIKAVQCWSDTVGHNNGECSQYIDNDGLCEKCEYYFAIKALETTPLGISEEKENA